MDKTLFSAGEVARLMEVDLKTIHTWIDHGKGPACHKTPGNHRRFHGSDLVSWMRARGVPIPDTLRRFATENEALGVDLRKMIDAMNERQRRALLNFGEKVMASNE